MSNVTVVYTKLELERAIERQDKTIAVKSASLADDVRTVKAASSGAFALAVGSAGVFATNFGIHWAGALALSERYLQAH